MSLILFTIGINPDTGALAISTNMTPAHVPLVLDALNTAQKSVLDAAVKSIQPAPQPQEESAPAAQ